MRIERILSMLLTAAVLSSGLLIAPEAHAKNKYWRDNRGRVHDNYGHQYYYDKRRSSWVDYQTGKILKGGLVGAGIGAGASLLLDRNVGKGALLGAGLGAGTQAVRYSSTMHRHPIAKTAAYGALAGVGVNALRRDGLGKGALWGGGIGAGLGALQHMDY
jgi:hypothetical protein